MSVSFASGALALGFLGSAHCAAMCGGFARASNRPLALHAGRIASYATAGAIVGAAGGLPVAILLDPSWQFAMFALACFVLFAAGARLAVPALPAAPLRLGPAFERVARAGARAIGPPSTGPRRFLLGALWGWAPCGLVYAALPLALASGSSAAGAITMAAFGLGTLPALCGAGWILARIGDRSRRWAGTLLMLLAIVALLGTTSSHPLFCGP